MTHKLLDFIGQLKSSILDPRSSNLRVYKTQCGIKNFLQRKKEKTYDGIEDGLKVFKLYRRFLKAEFSFGITMVTYFILLVCYFEAEVNKMYESSTIIIWSLFMTTIMAIICNIMLWNTRKQLAKQRGQKNYFFTYQVIVQFCLLLVQPYPWINDIYIERTSKQMHELQPIKLNYIFLMLSITKIVYVVRAALNFSTPYSNPRYYRISKFYGIHNTLFYNLRCLFRQKPFTLISILYFLCLLISAYCFRVCQIGINMNQFKSLSAMQNALWAAILTMTTVGFGDFMPVTIMGSMVTVVSSFTGVIVTSLFVLSITNNFQLQYGEQRSLLILKRFQKKKQAKVKSALYIRICLWRVWKEYSKKQMLSISAQEKQLRRQLWQMRIQEKNGLRQSSIFQQSMDYQFKQIRKRIKTIMMNSDQIIAECTKKNQFIDDIIQCAQQERNNTIEESGYNLFVSQMDRKQTNNCKNQWLPHRCSCFI